jgi:hypothetical protein
MKITTFLNTRHNFSVPHLFSSTYAEFFVEFYMDVKFW